MIPCLNGFTAEVREIEPGRYGSWYCRLALVTKDLPIYYFAKLLSLKDKDDPTKKIFGICALSDTPYNIKKVSWSDFPSQEDVISIKYEKRVEG